MTKYNLTFMGMQAMAHSTTYQFRIDDNEKKETFAILSELGVSPAQAIKMYFAQIRNTRSIPFAISTEPNEKTAKILLDQNNYSKSFDNLDDLFADLEKD